MTTHNAPRPELDDPTDAIAAHVHRYRSRLLSEGQASTMLEDIRIAVLRAAPTSPPIAGNWMSIACRFIADSAPAVGGSFDALFTPAKVTAWLADCARQGESKHTLRTRKGILDRVLRAMNGMEPNFAKTPARDLAPPPLSRTDVERLAAACGAAGAPAQRGFLATLGTGRSGSTLEGATLTAHPDGPLLRLVDGIELAVPRCVAALVPGVKGPVRDGDASEVRRVASTLGIYFDQRAVTQTFRLLALEDPGTLSDVLTRFHFAEPVLADIIPYLPRVDFTTDSVANLLRGTGAMPSRPRVQSAVNARKGTSGHAAGGSPRSGSEREGTNVVKKASAAEARRLAKAAREAASKYPDIPESIRGYIEGYAPQSVTDEVWRTIQPTFTEVLLRSGFRTDSAVRKHATTLVAYLAWRHGEGLSLEMNEAMRDAGIDQYYLRGSTDLASKTRNDYRSKLRTQARRVAPGVHAPIAPSLGYNSVKPGFTSVEEAMIRRVSLGQKRPEIRRRLCAIVGLGGGGGLDSQDLRYVLRRHITETETGIHIQVEGPKARLVVIRREYEEHVRAALIGLKPEDPMLRLPRDKANPVARVVNDAELFDDVPKIDMRRLRTTWITWLLTQPIPLPIVLQASGLQSARTLIDMVKDLDLGVGPEVLRDGRLS